MIAGTLHLSCMKSVNMMFLYVVPLLSNICHKFDNSAVK